MQLKDFPKIKGLVDRTRSQSLGHRQRLFEHPAEDILSGIVVFLVALPLCLGIALASGAPLISGLISGIIGGLVIGYISQSHTSVSGPAASVSAVVLVAIQDLGSFEIFLMALVIGGVIQFFIGLLRAGIIADYMPTSIIKGLLAAIGLILIISQLRYAVGLELASDNFMEYSGNFIENSRDFFMQVLNSFHPGAVILTAISLSLLLGWDKTPLSRYKLIPPSLVVVVLGVLINLSFGLISPALVLDGIHLVKIPTVDSLGELVTFPEFSAITNPKVWTTGLTIAVIASISSLLNIEATDNIDPHKRKTPPNRELIAQGIGNALAGLFGGTAITSVIVRSSVNIEAGSRSKLSTIIHGALLLLSVVLLSPIMNLIPLASLSAILLIVGYKLASLDVVKSLYKKGMTQFIPFVTTVVAILLTDVLVGVLIGAMVSIFYLLRGNYYNPFFIENSQRSQGNTFKLELSNEVSFLNKPSIKNTLWNIPDNSKVVIDASFSSFIDQDIIDMLNDFQNTVAREHHIDVKIVGLKDRYESAEELEFPGEVEVLEHPLSTPGEILEHLKSGHEKYTSGNIVSRRLRNSELRDFLSDAPLAAVINCVDFREPLNMLLNTDIGELVPIRSIGTLAVPEVVLGAVAACRSQGARLIIVMANSDNRFIREALQLHLDGVDSYLFPLVKNAAEAGMILPDSTDQSRDKLADDIARFNARSTAAHIAKEHNYVAQQIREGHIGVCWAFFDRSSGAIEFSELIH